MAAAASIVINGQISNTPMGTVQIGPLTISSAAANGETIQLVLQSGDNTITPPTNIATSGCIIVLPSNNTAVVTEKGVGGDTGIAIGKTTTQVKNWDSTAVPTSFILNSASTQTGKTTTIQFF